MYLVKGLVNLLLGRKRRARFQGHPQGAGFRFSNATLKNVSGVGLLGNLLKKLDQPIDILPGGSQEIPGSLEWIYEVGHLIIFEFALIAQTSDGRMPNACL
jgi:hypothetical protein